MAQEDGAIKGHYSEHGKFKYPSTAPKVRSKTYKRVMQHFISNNPELKHNAYEALGSNQAVNRYVRIKNGFHALSFDAKRHALAYEDLRDLSEKGDAARVVEVGFTIKYVNVDEIQVTALAGNPALRSAIPKRARFLQWSGP